MEHGGWGKMKHTLKSFNGKRYKIRKTCPGNRTGESYAITVPRLIVKKNKYKYMRFFYKKDSLLYVKFEK